MPAFKLPHGPSFSGLNRLPRRSSSERRLACRGEARQSEDWSSWSHDVTCRGDLSRRSFNEDGNSIEPWVVVFRHARPVEFLSCEIRSPFHWDPLYGTHRRWDLSAFGGFNRGAGKVYLPPAWAHFLSNLHSILFCSVDCFPKTFTGINFACIFD